MSDRLDGKVSPGQARPVWVLANDLMLGSRIRSVLETMKIPYVFLRSAEDFAGTPADLPAAMIVDLDASALLPIEAIRKAKLFAVPVLAYGSHVDDARLAEARNAGADAVVARSMIATRLGDLVAKLLDGTSVS